MWVAAAGLVLAGILGGCGSHPVSKPSSPATTTSSSVSSSTAAAGALYAWGDPKGGGKKTRNQPKLPGHSTPVRVTGVTGTVVQIATLLPDVFFRDGSDMLGQDV